MKKTLLVQLCATISMLLSTPFSFYAQTTDKQSNINCPCVHSDSDNEILFTIGGRDIKTSYFSYIFDKNNGKNVNDYIDMFINFQLKVIDAEDKGLDKSEEFLKEWHSYNEYARDSLIYDKIRMEGLIRIAYQRILHMRRAAHIVVKCPENASGEEVANAMMKINEARSRIVEYDERFSDVALKMSDDPSVKENKGELGWIYPFRYVYPMEEKIYSTPVGKVSSVFRTPFGFHIVFVEEELPFRKSVHVAHIMKQASNENAEMEINDIYLRVTHGENFESLAMNESDDKGSASKGGDLGFFSRGVMVPEFEAVAFEMNEGEISKPFKTSYGWHIIKYYESKEYSSEPDKDDKKRIRNQILKSPELSVIACSPMIEKVRKQCHIESSVSDAEVLAYARENLSKFDVRYELLCNEYHDGILLFENSKLEVWDKAKSKEEQDRIEKEWIKELRSRYNIIIHEDALKRLKKTLNQTKGKE